MPPSLTRLIDALDRVACTLERSMVDLAKCFVQMARRDVDVRARAAALDRVGSERVENACYYDRAHLSEGRYGKLATKFREVVVDKDPEILWTYRLKAIPEDTPRPDLPVRSRVVTNPYYSDEYSAVIAGCDGVLAELDVSEHCFGDASRMTFESQACIGSLKSGGGEGYAFASQENVEDLREYCEHMQARWGHLNLWAEPRKKRKLEGAADTKADEDEYRMGMLRKRADHAEALNAVFRDALRAKGLGEAQIVELEARCEGKFIQEGNAASSS